MLKQTILGSFLVFASTFLMAEQKQSLELIKQKIETYVLNELPSQNNDEIKVSADKIDSRLNLRACEEAELEVFNPYKTAILRTTTMGIRCNEKDTHWTLYVPVIISMKKRVLVAKQALPKGIQITEADIDEVTLDISQLKQGYFADKREVIDHACKQNIPEGTAFNAFNLQSALVIHKGEQVSIQAFDEMFSVSMHGIALNDGALGDVIRVQNLSSKRVIEAQISAPRQVRVTI